MGRPGFPLPPCVAALKLVMLGRWTPSPWGRASKPQQMGQSCPRVLLEVGEESSSFGGKCDVDAGVVLKLCSGSSLVSVVGGVSNGASLTQ